MHAVLFGMRDGRKFVGDCRMATYRQNAIQVTSDMTKIPIGFNLLHRDLQMTVINAVQLLTLDAYLQTDKDVTRIPSKDNFVVKC